jgi:hypothetical protein
MNSYTYQALYICTYDVQLHLRGNSHAYEIPLRLRGTATPTRYRYTYPESIHLLLKLKTARQYDANTNCFVPVPGKI